MYWKRESIYLERLLGCPREGTQTEVRCRLVLSSEVRQDSLHLVIFHECQDGVVLHRPGVIAIVRLSIDRTASVNVLPAGESPLRVRVKHLHDFFVVCLVI